MRHPQPPKAHPESGHGPPSIETVEQLVPLIREIHAAVGDLRTELDTALADLRRQLEGRTKSHYTVEEIAELTGRASYTVRSWIAHGRLTAIRVPGTGPKGRLLIAREELRKLVDRGRGRTVPAVAIG